jgi:hypothetical protein
MCIAAFLYLNIRKKKYGDYLRITFVVSGVIHTADQKKVDFKVEHICGEYEAICEKALTDGSGAQIEADNLVIGSL